MQLAFVEHFNRSIFLPMDERKFFYLDFVLVKFSYSNQQVSLAAVEVEH